MYKPFWARKIGPGWRGCSGMAEISQNMTFALWVGHFWWKTHFFHFWSKLVQITQKWSQMVQKWCLTVFYHGFGFSNCFTWFVAENINVPSRHTQKWHWNGLNIKKCHETTKITFDSYCETPCMYISSFLPYPTDLKSLTDTRTYSCEKRWPWKSTSQNPEFR